MGVERVTTGAASIAYAAPELLDGNRISSTTDQYSLAVTYFELRTGRLPYAEETVAAVLDAKRKETLDFSACLPAEQDVLRRATSCDPTRRFASSLEMVQALRRAVAGESTGAIGGPSPGGGRRRFWKVIAGLVLLASLGGAAGLAAWWHFGREPEVPKVAAKTTGGDDGNSAKAAAEERLAHATELMKNDATLDEAIKELQKVAAELPRDFRPLSRLGHAWLRKQQYDKAIEYCTLAIERTPDAIDYVRRGTGYRGLRQNDKAFEDANRAIELDKSNAGAFFLRAQCQYARNKAREGIDDLTEAIRLATQSPDPTFDLNNAYYLRGSIRLELDEAAAAEKDLAEAVRLNPSDALSWDTLASARDVLGNWKDAVTAEDMAVKHAPSEVKNKEYHAQLEKYRKRASSTPAASK